MRRFITVFAVVVNLVLLDAVAKEIAAGSLKTSAAVCIIPSFFNLAYVENRGCAWGMFQGNVWPLAAFAIIALGFLIWKRREIFGTGKAGAVTECLIYAGIIGNLIDRVFRGYVIDFFDFHWAEAYHFPCFNFADMFITFAAAILIISSFKRKEKSK